MMEMRKDLPAPTARIAALPLDHRGYPVPWFVAWLDDEGNETPRGQGTADHRVLRPTAIVEAVQRRVCWVCGQRLGNHLTFPIGPMCVVNRVTAEPPAHHDCAEWAVQACPFLSRPHASRREAGLPEDTREAPGTMIRRNPGVTALWTTKHFDARVVSNGLLFRVGELARPVEWWREGRTATRKEVLDSIKTGLPALREAAEHDGPEAVEELDRWTVQALELVPA